MNIHFLIILKYKLAGQLEAASMVSNIQYGLCFFITTSTNSFWLQTSKWYR